MLFNYYLNVPNFRTDLSKHHPVSVAANFAADGRFIPIYFRYEAEDCSRYTYKIEGIKSIKDKKDSISFCCYIVVEGIQQNLILTFYPKDCLWVLS